MEIDKAIIEKAEQAKKEFNNFADINSKLKLDNEAEKKALKDAKEKSAEAKAELESLLKEVASLEKKKESLANKTSDIIVDMQKEVSQKESELALLKKCLDDKEKELSEYQESLVKRGKELTVSQDKLNALIAEHGENSKLISAQLESAKKFHERASEKSIVLENKEEELNSLITQYKKLVSDLELEKNNFNILREDLVKQESNLSFREKQLADKEREYKLNVQSNAAKVAELDKYSKDLDSKLKGISDLELQLQAKEAKLNAVIRKRDLQDAIKAA